MYSVATVIITSWANNLRIWTNLDFEKNINFFYNNTNLALLTTWYPLSSYKRILQQVIFIEMIDPIVAASGCSLTLGLWNGFHIHLSTQMG